MKFLKILTILLFCAFIVLPVFSQDTGGVDTGSKPVSEEAGQKNTVSDDTRLSEEKKASDLLPEKGDVKITEPKMVEEKKESAKPRTLKKSPVESEKNIQKKMDGEPVLLRIDEGNFKYSRIPELALTEVKAPVIANSDIEDPDTSGGKTLPGNGSDESGFLGMKKGTADVVAKGGILLLILVVFILYKSRMKGAGKSKRGPGRNVLNSYRK